MAYDTLRDIRALVAWTYEQLGCAELTAQTDVEFNGRFTRRMGDAKYSVKGRQRVRFSRPLWKNASDEDKRETIIHEACHIAAEHLYGRGAGKSSLWTQGGHGPEWQGCMRKCGVSPKRYHKVSREGIKRKNSKVTANCGCDNGHVITKNRATRIRKGSKYVCLRCGVRLSLPGMPAEPPALVTLDAILTAAYNEKKKAK